MHQKIFIFSLINCFLIFIHIATATSEQYSSLIILDKIAAIINNDIILTSDIQNISKQIIKKQYKTNKKELQQQNIIPFKNTIEQLITDELIFQLATQLNIKIEDHHLNQIIDDIANENYLTTKEFFGILQKNNINYNSFKTQIRKKIIVSEFIFYEMQKKIHIFPEEIHKKIKKINTNINDNAIFQIKNISIILPKNPNTKQTKLAESLSINLIKTNNNNEEIKKIIMKHSNDQIKIKNDKISGKLKELPKFITENLIKIQQGNISKPIYSNNKINILMIDNVYLNDEKIYGTEIKTKQIFLENSKIKNNQKTYELLKDISKKIQNKQISFDDANKKISYIYSTKNQIKENNNNIEDFEPTIRNELISLKKQEISKPIHTNYGWHLIKITDIIQTNNVQSILKNYAYNILYDEKFTEEMQNWIIKLRNNSYIKILINNKKNSNDYS